MKLTKKTIQLICDLERLIGEECYNPNSFDGKFLLRKMAKGAVHQANINAQEFQSIAVLDVPKEDQDKYVSFLIRPTNQSLSCANPLTQ